MMKIRSRFLSKGLATVAVVVVALAGWVALSGVAEASEALQFSATPEGVSVESGEAAPKVAKVQAEGIKKNRIRYSLSGSGKFSINRKNGRIAYDGREIPKAFVRVTVTASDKDDEVDSISERITIDVSQPQAEQPVSQLQQAPEPAKVAPPKFMFTAVDGDLTVYSGEDEEWIGKINVTPGEVRFELDRGNGYYGSGFIIDQEGNIEYRGTLHPWGVYKLGVNAYRGDQHIHRVFTIKVLKSQYAYNNPNDQPDPSQVIPGKPDC